MKKIFIILLLPFLVLQPTLAQKKEDKRFAGLDTAFARVLQNWKAAGFAVAVIEKDKLIYAKGFGYRDYEKKLPVTANTLFAIGSCTKAFTASLMGMLEKDGKLDLNKPVRDYLPELRFYNESMNNQITVKDLMSHRTGLPRHDFSWYFFPSTRDSLLKRIQYQEPTTGIRTLYQYNNFMYLAQGVLAEKLYQQPWEQLIRSKLFDSLNMKRSNFSITALQKDADASLGYQLLKDSLIDRMDYYNIDAMGPAGSINSSVTEMANWARLWLNGGKVDGRQLIPAGFVAEAMSPQMVTGSGLPDKENPDIHLGGYGFAWSMASYRGHYLVQHGGNIDGFSANVGLYPSDSIAIVVLVNQNGSSVPAIVRNMLSDRLLNLPRKDWNGYLRTKADEAAARVKKSVASVLSNKKAGTTPSHSLSSYEGIYTNPGYGSLNLSLEADSLFAYTPTRKLWLRHYHYDIFEFFDVDPRHGIDTSESGESRFQFTMNAAGDIDGLKSLLQGGLEPIVFSRSEKPRPISAADLQKYLGDYDLAGQVTVKVYLKNETTLYVFVPGQPEYETLPLGNHTFSLKVLKGYSVKFDVTADGKVTGLTFIQPNGNFKAKRK